MIRAYMMVFLVAMPLPGPLRPLPIRKVRALPNPGGRLFSGHSGSDATFCQRGRFTLTPATPGGRFSGRLCACGRGAGCVGCRLVERG